MRQLAPVRVRFELGTLAVGDVPDDAENLIAVAADDVRLVDALGIVGP